MLFLFILTSFSHVFAVLMSALLRLCVLILFGDIAGPLAPPPPSMQITPQLPLMGFVARVQETSKWLSDPRSPSCMTTIR